MKKGIYKNPMSDWAPARDGIKCTVDMAKSVPGGRYYVLECEGGSYVSGKPEYWTWVEEENEFGPVSP